MVATLIEKHSAQVEWRPFYLRPDTPPEGMELPDYVRARAAQSQGRLKQMANAYGLEMVFATRIPNTRIAHESTEYARQKGKGFEFHHAVFDKFYGKGEDVSKWNVLRDAALQVGLDADEMQSEVEAGRYTATVNGLVKHASQIGVTGVPTYVLNDHYAIVGAQPYEAFLRAFKQIEADKNT
ncbi:DsbA family oxidoreductase [candidate division KSB1 bacterium]|nr:DsbA family oxidoreductase [candidate division KSB1 bacterium]MDL1879242.1 DsbA family oxidoreductase [Cytophagia bacterium CHB2]